MLREDPNVILVGEMRDLETIAAALTLAETGHLVLSTLHTQDAAQTVDRIIDVFPPYQQEQIRVMLASSLKGIVSQILLPRVDGNGRVAAREVLIVTPAISAIIREGKTHQIYSAIQTGTARACAPWKSPWANSPGRIDHRRGCPQQGEPSPGTPAVAAPSQNHKFNDTQARGP